MSIAAINFAFCEFLGIDPGDVVALRMDTRVGEMPTVTIVRKYVDSDALTQVEQRFELTLIEEDEDRAEWGEE